jgi:predicted  nucleic acid-binding Zn-ribbon protein
MVSFLVLFILNSAGSSGAASMLEGLTSFQESLTGWVDKVEDLEQRFSAVENDLEVKDKQLAEINSSLSKIEDLLSKLDSKIIVVQNMRSVAGLKKTLKSYEDTLDVFKKRFAEMAKRLEDQEVKISVLEKVYATAQNPVQTMMSELDQQNKRINVLADKVENQDKSLLVITEGIKKSKTPSEDIEKKIEEFNTRLTGLESDAISMRDTVAQKGHGTGTGEDAGSHATESTDHVVAGHQAESHDAGAHRQESQEMEGYIDIGMGFFVKDLKFSSFGSSCRVDGEMVNKSERYYSSADFVLKVFNNVGRQLGGHSFSIIALNQDHKKVFQEILTGVNEKEITNYTLYYAKMSSLLAKGEEELKMLERKHEGLVAEEAGRGSHKEKNGEREKPQVSKGFEDVGNGLYIGNVTFSVFGSSSSVAGVIQNHSDTDIDSASFLMKVFSKSYGMIVSLDFSVRRLDAGSSKPFEEILTGVQPTDIDRYEVTVKGSY